MTFQLNKRNALILLAVVLVAVGAYYGYQAWKQAHPGASSSFYADAAAGGIVSLGCARADYILHTHTGALIFVDPSGVGAQLMVAGSPAEGGLGKVVAGRPTSGWNKITAHACNATTGAMDMTVQSTNPHYPATPVNISVLF